MKLGIVNSAYHRSGGLERVAVEYARGLRDRGHDVTVFAQRWRREPGDDGIRFERVGGARGSPTLRALTFPLAAEPMVRRARLDNVLAFGSVLRMPAVVRAPGCHKSWWRAANRDRPATSLEGLRRRLNPHHRVVLGWDRLVLGAGRPRAVLAASDWAAEEIRAFYPAAAPSVETLPDGVNLDEFRFDERGRERLRERWRVGDAPLVLTIATELRRKNLGTLLEAFGIVLQAVPDARLVIAGRAPVAEVRALAARHGSDASVLAAGFVEDLTAAYSAADALAFPTRFDPWGLPVVEALACGTPVAVSARAGAALAVHPGSNGAHVVDPADARQVARAALDVLSLRPHREAVRASVEHLAWARVVARIEAILQRTAG